MADVVRVITAGNPGDTLTSSVRGIGGGALGAAAAMATRATSNIPGANVAIAGLQNIAGDFLQGDRNVTGIYNGFLTQILQDYTSSPSIMPLWVCYIDIEERDKIQLADKLDKNSGGKHVTTRQGLLGLSRGQHSAGDLGRGLALMFCQGVQVPSDSISVRRDSYSSAIGGYIPGLIGDNRSLSEVTISFLENNASFTDFVLRPWMMYNSYYGIPNGIKSNIIIEEYVRTLPDKPLRLRKKITLHKAFPTTIDSLNLQYKDTTDTRQIQFAYESYNIEEGGDWGISQINKDQSLLGKLGELALNVATGLVNKEIEKFESNLFSIKPQLVNIEPPATPPSEVAKQSVSNVSITSSDHATQSIKSQIIKNIKDDTPTFELVNNNTKKVIIPAEDMIDITQLKNISKIDQVIIPEADVVTASEVRTDYVGVYPPKEDTPTLAPFRRPDPATILPRDDMVSRSTKIDKQSAIIGKDDEALKSRINVQKISINSNDSRRDKSYIPVQIISIGTNDYRKTGANVLTQPVNINSSDSRKTGTGVITQPININSSDSRKTGDGVKYQNITTSKNDSQRQGDSIKSKIIESPITDVNNS